MPPVTDEERKRIEAIIAEPPPGDDRARIEAIINEPPPATTQPADDFPNYRLGTPRLIAGTRQDYETMTGPEPIDQARARQFGEIVAQLPPEKMENVRLGQQLNEQYRPVSPEREPGPVLSTVLEGISPMADLWLGTPARLAGVDQPPISEGLPPPRSQAEGLARAGALIGGEVASFLGPGTVAKPVLKAVGAPQKVAKAIQATSLPHLAAEGAAAATRAAGATGRVLPTAAAIAGFTAPIAASEAISGDSTAAQAVGETLAAPVKLPIDVAKSAYEGVKETAKAVSDPSPEQTLKAAQTIAPAAAIVLPAVVGRKPAAKGKPVEAKPEPPGIGEQTIAQGGPFKYRSTMGNIAHETAKGLRPRGDLPPDVFERNQHRMAQISEGSKEIQFDLKDLDTAVKKAYGTKRPPKEAMEAMDAVFKGEEALHRLPEEVQPVIAKLRDKTDAMSRALIDSGAVEGPVVATIEKNIGFYAKRAYRAFKDPKWAENVPEEVRNKAKALLRSENPEATESQINAKIDNILYEGKAAESPIAMLAKGSKLGSKDLSILMRRKDIAPEIRELLGEYKDVRFNYANSMESMGRLIANHQFLTDVRKTGAGKGFLSEKAQGENIVRIAADESSVMSPLNGLFTHPDIKRAFEEFGRAKDHPSWLKLYMKANQASKGAKTVGSVITHVRNLVSGTAAAVATGNWNPVRFIPAIKAVRTNLTGGGSQKSRDYVLEATKYGLLDKDARAGELQDLVKTIGQMDNPNSVVERMMANPVQRGLDVASKVYQSQDNLWRLFLWEGEVAKYKKAFPDTPIEQIKADAAKRVRSIYQDYSMVPKAVKAIRDIPVVGNFPSFTYELFRTNFNLLKLAAQELKDPRTRPIAAQRIAGILAAYAGTGAATTASRWINGITRDEDNDYRKFMPPWSQNGQIVYLNKGDKGKLNYVDLSYTDYYGQLKSPIVALLRGEDWGSALWDSATQAFKSFADEEILASKLIDVARNTKPSGGPVYNPQAPELDQQLAKLAHVLEALTPGTVDSAQRIYQGATGRTNEYGMKRELGTEIVNVVSGIRHQKLDIAQSLSFAARRFSEDTRNAATLLTSPAQRKGDVPIEEVVKGGQDASSARRQLFSDMNDMVSAARRSGISDRELMKILSSGGVSKQDSALLVRGRYSPQRISDVTMGRVIEAPQGRERARAVKEELRKQRKDRKIKP